MFLAGHPDRRRTDAEKEEIAKKYKSGDRVMPKVRAHKKSERERRAEEQDRRILDEVRDISLREAGVDTGSGSTSRRREERRKERERERSRNPSRESRMRRESRDRSQRQAPHPESRTSSGDEARSYRLAFRREHGTGSDTEGRQRSRRPESRRRSADGADSTPLRQVEHQSSLRELIASHSDAQREIEEFSRQIQEEGLLDGLDLDNIDLTEDSELSRRITEAYRRRQRQRSRTEPIRRSNASAMSRNSEQVQSPGSGSGSDAPRLRACDATTIAYSSRPASRHARSISTTSQNEERSRPPVSNAFLDPRSDAERRRRRRTSSETRSESRSNTDPTRPSVAEVRPAPRSTSDLPIRARRRADSAGSTAPRPVTADSRTVSSPTVALPDQGSNSHTLSFRDRMPPIAVTGPTPQQSPPQDQQPAETPAAARQRRSRPADISVPTPGPTVAPTSAVGGAVVAPLPSSGMLAPTIAPARPNVRSHIYIEPIFDCTWCNKPRIQYEVHYNCFICSGGSWNICLDCYRNRKGCRHWFGFGKQAFERWEEKRAIGPPGAQELATLERPHILAAMRFMKPQKPTTTNEKGQTVVEEDPSARLQSGNFCVRCLAWANDCYWWCMLCNFGHWGYCNDCVNTGHCCTHPLLPLTFRPDEQAGGASAPASTSGAAGIASPPPSPRSPNPPQSASVVDSHSMFYPFRPLTFTTTCDMCQKKILPTNPRLHCYQCRSGLVPGAKVGDYDICLPCYSNLEATGKISRDNGMSGTGGTGAGGWRRCLQGHRMAVVSFQQEEYGRRRVVVGEVVGGCSLEREEYDSSLGLEKWKWPNGSGAGFASRLVCKKVDETPPPVQQAAMGAADYPPNGGMGRKAITLHGWYPRGDREEDELMMPQMAEITEAIDCNETFWRGAYMGKVGYFPVDYVKVLEQ
ncbi:hypothetical protein MKZ38_006119 [Zalerion maritima]|uniref:SH3 domain-containing protein n=1 Tax=Zalerion maritima TaxID=339359 RepID=A0AAD5RWP0_9PEZI|nr:hypothetical protein MKZ38_006119 [Zalerion maritima]